MPTISNSRTVSQNILYSYLALATVDTNPERISHGKSRGFIQAFGTFGGATVNLQGSNDGTNWVNLTTNTGAALALTAAGGAEFDTAAQFIRPLVTGGVGDSINVLITIRG